MPATASGIDFCCRTKHTGIYEYEIEDRATIKLESAHLFAAPFHQHRTAKHERGHIAADRGSNLGELLAAFAQAPKFVEGYERCGGISASASQAAANGNLLFNLYRRAFSIGATLAQNFRRLDAKVVGKTAVAGNVRIKRKFKSIGKRHRHHDRTQRMIAVLPLAEKLKREIYFGERLDSHARKSLIAA